MLITVHKNENGYSNTNILLPTEVDFEATKEDLEIIKPNFEETKEDLEVTKADFEDIREDLGITKDAFEITKDVFETTKNELEDSRISEEPLSGVRKSLPGTYYEFGKALSYCT